MAARLAAGQIAVSIIVCEAMVLMNIAIAPIRLLIVNRAFNLALAELVAVLFLGLLLEVEAVAEAAAEAALFSAFCYLLAGLIFLCPTMLVLHFLAPRPLNSGRTRAAWHACRAALLHSLPAAHIYPALQGRGGSDLSPAPSEGEPSSFAVLDRAAALAKGRRAAVELGYLAPGEDSDDCLASSAESDIDRAKSTIPPSLLNPRAPPPLERTGAAESMPNVLAVVHTLSGLEGPPEVPEISHHAFAPRDQVVAAGSVEMRVITDASPQSNSTQSGGKNPEAQASSRKHQYPEDPRILQTTAPTVLEDVDETSEVIGPLQRPGFRRLQPLSLYDLVARARSMSGSSAEQPDGNPFQKNLPWTDKASVAWARNHSQEYP